MTVKFLEAAVAGAAVTSSTLFLIGLSQRDTPTPGAIIRDVDVRERMTRGVIF
jgi:hypothetical protein